MRCLLRLAIGRALLACNRDLGYYLAWEKPAWLR